MEMYNCTLMYINVHIHTILISLELNKINIKCIFHLLQCINTYRNRVYDI